MDNLTEEEYYEKKSKLMRKLTQKATKFLYEKEKAAVHESRQSTGSLPQGRRLFDDKSTKRTATRMSSMPAPSATTSQENLNKKRDPRRIVSGVSILEDDS